MNAPINNSENRKALKCAVDFTNKPENKAAMNKLLGCPFCGEQPEYDISLDSEGNANGRALGHCHAIVDEKDEIELFRKWNTRAPNQHKESENADESLIARFAETDIEKLKAGEGQEWINLRIRIADAKYALQQHKRSDAAYSLHQECEMMPNCANPMHKRIKTSAE